VYVFTLVMTLVIVIVAIFSIVIVVSTVLNNDSCPLFIRRTAAVSGVFVLVRALTYGFGQWLPVAGALIDFVSFVLAGCAMVRTYRHVVTAPTVRQVPVDEGEWQRLRGELYEWLDRHDA